MSFVKPSKTHLIRRSGYDKPAPTYGEVVKTYTTPGVVRVQWYDAQNRPLDDEMVTSSDYDYIRKGKPRKTNPHSKHRNPEPPAISKVALPYLRQEYRNAAERYRRSKTWAQREGRQVPEVWMENLFDLRAQIKAAVSGAPTWTDYRGTIWKAGGLWSGKGTRPGTGGYNNFGANF